VFQTIASSAWIMLAISCLAVTDLQRRLMPAVVGMPMRPTYMRVFALLALVMSLVILWQYLGAARAIPMWFGLLMTIGLSVVMIAGWRPKFCSALAAGALCCASVSSVALVMKGL